MTDEKDKADEIEFIPEEPADEGAGAPERPAPEKKEKEGEDKPAENCRHVKDKLKKKEAEIKALKKELD